MESKPVILSGWHSVDWGSRLLLAGHVKSFWGSMQEEEIEGNIRQLGTKNGEEIKCIWA